MSRKARSYNTSPDAMSGLNSMASNGTPSIEKDDVAEMQVAMEAPNQASVSACDEGRAKAGMGGVPPLRERLNLRGGEEIGTLAQCGVVLFDIIGEGGDPRLSFDRAGAGVKRRHRAAEGIREHRIDFARLRQPVERR